MRIFRLISVSLVLFTVGLLVLWYGAGFKWQMPWRSLAQGRAGAAGPAEVGPVVRLEPFLVTEWDGERERYVTVTFELEVTDDEGRLAVVARTSNVRSEILALLADLHLSDLGDASDYEALKKQVQSRLQPLLPGQPIRHVLITQFLIE
jgi:flagellar basal body-associated protein FliL